MIDGIIAEVLSNLRREIPGLAIDDRSFPDSPNGANLFLDLSGMRCGGSLPCRAFDIWPAILRAHRIYDPNSSRVDVIRALAFFDQLRFGRWVPGPPLFR